MTGEHGPRRRDAAATREALLAAATELFTARGFDRTSVRDIAARAEVNQALVFRYFGSKEELLGAVLTAPGRALLAQTEPAELLAEILHQVLADPMSGEGGNLLMLALTDSRQRAAAEVLDREVAEPLRAALTGAGAEDSAVRAELTLAWILGLVLNRHLRPTGAIARADPATVAALVLDSAPALRSRTNAETGT